VFCSNIFDVGFSQLISKPHSIQLVLCFFVVEFFYKFAKLNVKSFFFTSSKNAKYQTFHAMWMLLAICAVIACYLLLTCCLLVLACRDQTKNRTRQMAEKTCVRSVTDYE
jgi:hypothetical protein